MKAFKIRVEDTTDGEVTEFESDCVSVIGVNEEHDDSKKLPVKIFSGGRCTKNALIALIKALDQQQEKIFKRLFSDMITEEDDA